MTHPVCNLCSKSAIYDFGGSFLCAHCATAMLKRCRIPVTPIASSLGVKVTAGEIAPPAPTPAVTFNSSSGDGPGIQQPRSMTWGGREATPAPSGRARDRAMCPAVTGSSSCGDEFVDVPAQMQGSNDCGLARDDVKPGDTMQESRPARPVKCPQVSIPDPVSSPIPPAPALRRRPLKKGGRPFSLPSILALPDSI